MSQTQMTVQHSSSANSGPPLLASGVDTLEWSARAAVEPDLERLFGAKQDAALADQSGPWASVAGLTLSVLPHGSHGFPIVLESAELRCHVTPSRARPTVWVQLRSGWLHEVGARGAVERSIEAAQVVVGRLSDPHVSRIDAYADFGGWRLVHADRDGFVTHAKLAAYFRAGTDEIETLYAGKSPLLVRLYRKDLEGQKDGAHAPLFWGGWSGPVTRVEVEARSQRLRSFGIGTVDEALRSLGDVWRYATTDFLELRVPSPAHREEWPLRAEWRAVQAVGFEQFPHSGLVPERIVTGNRLVVLRSLYGYLTSLGAIDDVHDLHRLVGRLPRELADVVGGRSFDREVERKRARLPGSVIQAVRFRRDRSPSPKGGDIEGSTVGSDA